MANMLTNSDRSDPVRDLDTLRPRPAKAGLHRTDQSEPVGSSDRIGPVVAAAVVKHYGSVKAAAISLGNVDPSLMQREFEAGKFGRLDCADDAVKAAVAAALTERFGHLSDPKDRARRQIREARRAIDELSDYIEYAS